MKARKDFVSNSSSCSFVVSVKYGDGYSFYDFVEDVVADCRASAEPEYDTPESIARLDAMNRRNLQYHLKASELLFLGMLETSRETTVVKRSDDERWFGMLEKQFDGGLTGERGQRLESRTADEMRVSYPETYGGIAVPSSSMPIVTGHYSWIGRGKAETAEEKKASADRIFKYVKELEDGENRRPDAHARLWAPEIYFISKETVRNTRCLLEAGYRLVFAKWEDLDDVERRLGAGESLYFIRQNNGGDGMDDFTVYGLGGWDAAMGKRARFETLACGD